MYIIKLASSLKASLNDPSGYDDQNFYKNIGHDNEICLFNETHMYIPCVECKRRIISDVVNHSTIMSSCTQWKRNLYILCV